MIESVEELEEVKHNDRPKEIDLEQVDSNSLLLRGDLILAVNGTLLVGKQVNEVEDLVTGQSDLNKKTHLLNLILWRNQEI